MKKPAPNQGATMQLLGRVMEAYSWKEFKPILYDPERLKTWILEKIADGEVTIEVDEETKALELLKELTKEEREMIRTALRDLWGKAGASSLPAEMR